MNFFKEHKTENKNKEIENWWDSNPFTFGVSNKDHFKSDLVGRIEEDKMNLDYFNNIERKWRKHSFGGGQEEGKPVLSKLIDYDLLRDRNVLDIAVGSGFSLVTFAKEGAYVTGIDITDYAVSQSRKNLELRGLNGKVLKMDAQKLEFSNNYYDFVNAWGCLMHMPDTQKAIKEIHRVTKPGGRVLAYMYNKSSWPFWFNLILLKGIFLGGLVRFRGDVTRLTSRYSDGYTLGGNPLTKFYKPSQVKKMFKDAGFSIVDVHSWDLSYEPDGWPLRIFPVFKYLPKNIKAYMSKNWGYGLIVKAQK